MYAIILGCGRVGSTLAQLLSEEGHDVVIIDASVNSFRRLGQTFNGLTLCGDGLNSEFLETSGIRKADVFCAVTEYDNTNLMAAQIAKKMFGVRKVFARVFDPQRADLFQSMGLDIISGTMLIASMIRDKIIEAKIATYVLETSELKVVRFKAAEPFAGKQVKDITLDDECSVIALVRSDGTVLPKPETVISAGDTIVCLVRMASLEKIKKIFKL